MALEAHLQELDSKHKRIEREIEQALAHPSTDDLTVTRLKREKLRLKDEITRLKSSLDS